MRMRSSSSSRLSGASSRALGLAWDDGVKRFYEHAANKHIASPSRTQVA